MLQIIVISKKQMMFMYLHIFFLKINKSSKVDINLFRNLKNTKVKFLGYIYMHILNYFPFKAYFSFNSTYST